MSALMTIDDGSDIAIIHLAAWEPALARVLRDLFTVTKDCIRLDFSRLSSDHSASRHNYDDFLPPRVRLQVDLSAANARGQLELFVEIFGHREAWEGSGCLRDGETFSLYEGDGAASYIYDSLHGLRTRALYESTFSSRWVRWALASRQRSVVLADQELIKALLSRVQNDGDFRVALSQLLPQKGDDGWAVAKLIDDCWPLTKAFIANYFADAQTYRSDNVQPLVISLFRTSIAVQSSRWACDQVVQNAHPDLLPHCHMLTAEDVRRLMQRYHDADGRERKALEPGVLSAVISLGRLLGFSLPTDIALAGLWLNIGLADVELPTPAQAEINAILRELPTGEWGSDTLWEQLGPDARASWRSDLLQRVSDHQELAHGLIDFACRWLDRAAFAEIEPVLLKLVNNDLDLAYLQDLKARGPRLVMLRTEGLARTKLEAASGLSQASGERYESLPEVGARTWLGDPAAEQVVRRAVASVETSFCGSYRDQWGADEEMLTAELLAHTRAAADEATKQLRQLAINNRSQFPIFSVEVRQPGKSEEGKPTSAGAPLAADVLFLTRIQEGPKILVERATFVQVKKRRAGSSQNFSSTVAIDLDQCEDLLTQSEHSYYLILTPPSPYPELWVTPARLVRNLTRLHEGRSSISALQARDASCSYADFFLHQLVGLWSGDERANVIAIAKGDRSLGRTPRYVVDIIVQRRGD